jgi:hypothetical protein
VHLENGEVLTAKTVVIATEAGGAERLSGQASSQVLKNDTLRLASIRNADNCLT